MVAESDVCGDLRWLQVVVMERIRWRQACRFGDGDGELGGDWYCHGCLNCFSRHGKGEAAKEEWKRSRNEDGGVGDPRRKGDEDGGCRQ